MRSQHHRRWLGFAAAVLAGGVAVAVASWPIATTATAATSPTTTPKTATATNWYVDCSAAANGSGTASAPWNNLASASAHTFAPGDKLLLKRGITCTGQLAPKGDGTADAPIVIDGYGTAATAPLIAGNGITGHPLRSGGPSVGGGAVQLTDQSYWTVQNLQVTNTAGAEAQRDGIEVLITDGKEHDNIIIRDDDVHDVTGVSDRTHTNGFYLSHGIGVDLPVDGGFVKNLQIWGNTVHQVHGNGIGLYGDQGTGTNSNAVRNQHVVISTNTLTQVSNDGIVVCASDSPLIEENVADQLGWQAVDAQDIAGMWAWGSTDPTFQRNEVSHITGTGGDMEAWDCDGRITGTCTFQDNYDHDNSGGIFLNCTGCGGSEHTKIVFRHNVSIKDCRIINSGNNVASFAFHDNTIDCRDTAWKLAFPAVTALTSNIFIGKSGSTLPGGVTYRANTYFGFTAPTSDPQGSTADPLLYNADGSDPSGINALGGYRLRTGSPALGTGVLVPGDDWIDIWNNPVTTSINRGAYSGTGVS